MEFSMQRRGKRRIKRRQLSTKFRLQQKFIFRSRRLGIFSPFLSFTCRVPSCRRGRVVAGWSMQCQSMVAAIKRWKIFNSNVVVLAYVTMSSRFRYEWGKGCTNKLLNLSFFRRPCRRKFHSMVLHNYTPSKLSSFIKLYDFSVCLSNVYVECVSLSLSHACLTRIRLRTN